MITRRGLIQSAGVAALATALPALPIAETLQSQATRYVDGMIAGGYKMVLIEGCFSDGGRGISTAFPEGHQDYDPLLDESLPRLTARDELRALADELRRRGMVLRSSATNV